AKVSSVRVVTDQLSLAIGKGGQNVRLAAKLTGYKINIVENDKEEVVESAEPAVEMTPSNS
ncbi:MAG: transcription termination/antitermination protein NusA, partial [Patescibacteria group bacterium]